MLLSNKITQQRKGWGWSVNDLARKAGISVSMVCAIESGDRTGTLKTLRAIAEALDTSLPGLLRDTEWD